MPQIYVSPLVKLGRGQQIACVPDFAQDELGQPDLSNPAVEFGFVVGPEFTQGSGEVVYACRYWRQGHLGELRTKANSEMTPRRMLVLHVSVPQPVVEAAIKEYCT